MKILPKFSALFLLGLACTVAILLVLFPPAAVCVTYAGVYIQGWLSAPVRWLFLPLVLALCVGSWALWRFAEKRLADSRLSPLALLAYLPSLVALPHVLVWIDHTLAGLVLPLGGTFLAAMILERFLRQGLDSPIATSPRSAKAAWLWFGATFLLLFAFYHGMAQRQYFGSGDDVHYNIQVKNLLEYGNLDLTDRVETMMERHNISPDPSSRNAFLNHSHLKMNDNGRIYTGHSFGFPLLVWPFRMAFGWWGDGLLLALLGAMALCGVRAACLAHGAPRLAADTMSVLTGLSFMWVYTAMSFLPEMLGFGLVAWAFWAVAAQGRTGQRWLATVVSAVVCAYLPVAHIRFTPTAGLLAACFGIEGLCLRDEPFLKSKLLRLGMFSLACFGAWGGLWYIHSVMFHGTAAYDYANIAGRTPLAMWGMFADQRGLVSLVPALPAFLMATVAALFRKDAIARHAAMALGIAAATLWFCCSNTEALGGACLSGRYFYTAVPLFLPFFAIALPGAARPGRLWLLFLALLPVTYLLFLAPFLKGSSLLYSPSIRAFLNLTLFWDPFVRFFGGDVPILNASCFAVTLFGISGLACTRCGGFLRIPAAVILLSAAFFFGRAANRAASPQRREVYSVLLGQYHFHDFKVLGGTYTDFFDALQIPGIKYRIPYVLSDDPEHFNGGEARRLEHPSALSGEDWHGRPIRWGNVLPYFSWVGGRRGFVACRATGRVVRGTALLALQIDGVHDAPEVVLPEGPFDVTFHLRVYNRNGGANFRLALENDIGEAYVATTQYEPCPPALPAKLGGFPSSTTVIEVPTNK